MALQDTCQQVRVEASVTLDMTALVLRPRAQPIIAGQLVASPLSSLQRQGWQAHPFPAGTGDREAPGGVHSVSNCGIRAPRACPFRLCVCRPPMCRFGRVDSLRNAAGASDERGGKASSPAVVESGQSCQEVVSVAANVGTTGSSHGEAGSRRAAAQEGERDARWQEGARQVSPSPSGGPRPDISRQAAGKHDSAAAEAAGGRPSLGDTRKAASTGAATAPAPAGARPSSAHAPAPTSGRVPTCGAQEPPDDEGAGDGKAPGATAQRRDDDCAGGGGGGGSGSNKRSHDSSLEPATVSVSGKADLALAAAGLSTRGQEAGAEGLRHEAVEAPAPQEAEAAGPSGHALAGAGGPREGHDTSRAEDDLGALSGDENLLVLASPDDSDASD